MLVGALAGRSLLRDARAADLSDAETAAFFSTTLIERRPPFNFVDLYIPANPFYSLANNVVPAVVLFSIVLGVAVIGLDRKAVLLDLLHVASAALSRGDEIHRPADAVWAVRDRGDRGRAR